MQAASGIGPLTRSKMPTMSLRWCCLQTLLVVGCEQALGSSQLQVVASATGPAAAEDRSGERGAPPLAQLFD